MLKVNGYAENKHAKKEKILRIWDNEKNFKTDLIEKIRNKSSKINKTSNLLFTNRNFVLSMRF